MRPDALSTDRCKTTSSCQKLSGKSNNQQMTMWDLMLLVPVGIHYLQLPETKWNIKQPTDDDVRLDALDTGRYKTTSSCQKLSGKSNNQQVTMLGLLLSITVGIRLPPVARNEVENQTASRWRETWCTWYWYKTTSSCQKPSGKSNNQQMMMWDLMLLVPVDIRLPPAARN